MKSDCIGNARPTLPATLPDDDALIPNPAMDDVLDADASGIVIEGAIENATGMSPSESV